MRQPTALIRLSKEGSKTLQDGSRWSKSERRLVERAKIILRAGEGRTNQQIAPALQTRTARVSKWGVITPAMQAKVLDATRRKALSDSTQMLPPRRSAILWQIARPIPLLDICNSLRTYLLQARDVSSNRPSKFLASKEQS